MYKYINKEALKDLKTILKEKNLKITKIRLKEYLKD